MKSVYDQFCDYVNALPLSDKVLSQLKVWGTQLCDDAYKRGEAYGREQEAEYQESIRAGDSW